MKVLQDFLPILLFFTAFKFFDIYVATAAAILCTCFQAFFTWRRQHKIEPMQLISVSIIILFGGATLAFKNDIFIKWKPTVIFWLLGSLFFLSHFFQKKTLAQRMMEHNLTLPEKIWRRLNQSWIFFFFIMGSINLYVVYHFDTNTWVNFKLFGILGSTFLFVFLQAWYLGKFIHTDEPSSAP